MPAIKHPTVVIHGFFVSPVTNVPTHLALRARGFQTHNVRGIPGMNIQDPRTSAERTHETIERIIAGSNADKVNLVGISLGGLIGLCYLRKYGSLNRVQTFAAMGSPFHGTKFSVVGQPVFGLIPQLHEARDTVKLLGAGSELMDYMHSEPVRTCRVVSVWAKDDPIVSQHEATLEWAENLQAPTSMGVLSHHTLVAHPTNLFFLADVLAQ